MPSPHPEHAPQSDGHDWQLSLPLHVPSPQMGPDAEIPGLGAPDVADPCELPDPAAEP